MRLVLPMRADHTWRAPAPPAISAQEEVSSSQRAPLDVGRTAQLPLPPSCLLPGHSFIFPFWFQPRSVTREDKSPCHLGLPTSLLSGPSNRGCWFSPAGLV